jgi:predicted dehydrogenase
MPNNLNSQQVVLFGIGTIGREYCRILQDLGVDFTAVGNSATGVENFISETGIQALPGGVKGWKKNGDSDIKSAIVAVNLEELAQTAIDLMENGFENILLEKPGGMNSEEIRRVKEKAHDTRAKVWIAYNRRFFASVLKAQEIILQDGGVKSFNFEFTEWPHKVLSSGANEVAKKNWFLVNSTHVVDMAFLLGGFPEKLESFTVGGCDWHPDAAIFAGSGVSELGALFSYQANWLAPGRWSVEILTLKNRLVFRPLEKLQVQKPKSVAIEFVKIDDQLDVDFKPGFFKQTELFLQGANHDNFVSIEQHYDHVTRYFQKIGYPRRKE